MDLKSRLFLNRPRENAGPKTSNRYNYQKDWAICKLLDLHNKPDDYLLCFEFHDDIIVFDSSSDPKKINCYQVKTKDSPHWTLSALTAQKKIADGTDSSILGKLHLHLADYEDALEGLHFVTNSKVKATLANNFDCLAIGSFSLNELCDKDLQKITDKLAAELNEEDLGKFTELTKVLMGELSIKDHSEITQYRLAAFIEDKMPRVKYRIGPFYRTIFDEVKNKTDVEEEVINFSTLKKLKSISRSDFSKFLSALSEGDEMKDLAVSIEHRLNSESVDFKTVNGFRNQAKIYEVERMNKSNKNLLELEKHITEVMASQPNSEPKLIDQLNEVFSRTEISSNLFSDQYIKTIILFKLYGSR